MATGLTAQYGAGQDVNFIQRVQVAILAAAQAISSEATTTADHANRVALMKAIANGPATYAPIFAALLAAEGVDNTSADTAINTMVSAVWDTVAGVP